MERVSNQSPFSLIWGGCDSNRQLHHMANSKSAKCLWWFWTPKGKSMVPEWLKASDKMQTLSCVCDTLSFVLCWDLHTCIGSTIKKLSSVNFAPLLIMGISWYDRICNGKVLQRAKIERKEGFPGSWWRSNYGGLIIPSRCLMKDFQKQWCMQS